MGSEQKRTARKAEKAAAARRRAARPKQDLPPVWDGDLPRTKEEIETELDAVAHEMLSDPPSRVEHGDDYKKVFLSPSQQKFMRLQCQLFRAVFGREPNKSDPIFWDRARESEGVFRVDTEQNSLMMSQALNNIDIRPEVAYAIALTGLMPTERHRDAYATEDLEEWESAIADYQFQNETGVVPLTPPEFLHAWNVINQTSGEYAELSKKKKPDTDLVERLLGALERELGTPIKAAAAMSRMAAVITITQQPEFARLLSSTGFAETAVVAAASAEIVSETQAFDTASFRRKLKEIG